MLCFACVGNNWFSKNCKVIYVITLVVCSVMYKGSNISCVWCTQDYGNGTPNRYDIEKKSWRRLCGKAVAVSNSDNDTLLISTCRYLMGA